jgi:hypothetical protein
MHIATANFYLLSVTGPKMPADMRPDMERAVAQKAQVIDWLKRSLEAVRTARTTLKPGDLQRKVKTDDRDIMSHGATIDGMYLRIIIHDNEHMANWWRTPG